MRRTGLWRCVLASLALTLSLLITVVGGFGDATAEENAGLGLSVEMPLATMALAAAMLPGGVSAVARLASIAWRQQAPPAVLTAVFWSSVPRSMTNKVPGMHPVFHQDERRRQKNAIDMMRWRYQRGRWQR
eukprot:TRINITY_DN111668_c0_g1_i1.p1 TRINITY_DN111668_c0_g1~~TRINITY_DN111668_c0_g1_i1.p1  ORF type:complete len:131 (+),score=13.53 TRINITY_DN111668_c0_g1_i1:144-536(+)